MNKEVAKGRIRKILRDWLQLEELKTWMVWTVVLVAAAFALGIFVSKAVFTTVPA